MYLCTKIMLPYLWAPHEKVILTLEFFYNQQVVLDMLIAHVSLFLCWADKKEEYFLLLFSMNAPCLENHLSFNL